ncbi:phosphatidate phosphatase LPIN1 isoform X1 [Maylandia zebra]|uniref:phosphatidate phosphatase n=3 Tax=Haplochromini TaxID=319058 RepID=A0A3P9CCM8_9CICH|nr:phosphatidate phosphatase LPIN1 isoform X1 [Maylandia zebra]XP_025998067.1 phosphatidate phosphatase LPIN1 isoform X1 [Astatotilapia calliptera]
MISAEDGDELDEAAQNYATDTTWSWTRQTMNFVGQLAGQVFVQVKELYRGLNPATLSGCIDVIVVRQPDGSLQCSPFHVRFGKLGVLRSREKVVDMEINGEPVDLHMKLGENGEAFFVQETENDQEVVPSYLATSPILSDGPVLMGKISGTPIQNLCSVASNGENSNVMMKKRRKRRRKARADSLRREESGDYSADEDMFPIDISSDEVAEMESNRSSSRDVSREENTVGSTNSSFKQAGMYTRSDGEWSPIQSPGNSRPTSPKSDSELIGKPSNTDNQNPEMHWAWGELPQAAMPSVLPLKSSPPPVCPVSIPVSESTHFRVITPEVSSEQCGPCSEIPALRLLMPTETMHTEEMVDAESIGMESQTITSAMQVTTVGGVAARMVADMEDTSPRPQGKADSPSKKKDKRSRHLGSDGIYLDDITELEPEVAALYFPKSDTGATVRSISDPGLHSTSQSPQSVSSGGDSGVDSYCDPMSDLPSIAISLCGGLNDNREITKEQFYKKTVSYQQFTENPSIIDDPNLVVKIGSKYYNWNTAAPLVLAMQAFQKPLPKAAVENIMKEKMPKKAGRWWFSWRSKNSSAKSDSASERGACCTAEQVGNMTSRLKEESSSSDEDHREAKQNSSLIQTEPVLTTGGVSYKKTLRLTSEQLLSLQLQDGPNDVVFSVTTQYQGTCRCQGTIYLWNWDDKIIISDIDGTITRSDTLGHILPTLGKDWTHQGIAQLYHKVSQNGYKFLYCSARAIGMADMTRGYLNWVNERGTMLPMGPVLLSPSSLFSALHREVIEKKPEKFKVECLTDIKNLFYPNKQPFYAAFGNRPTDVYSYKEVGVSLNRIFTVNPKGELVQEHAKTNISSYVRLCEVVDHVFPLKARASSSDFPCSDTYSHFTYWREQFPLVESQETTPQQTASSSS